MSTPQGSFGYNFSINSLITAWGLLSSVGQYNLAVTSQFCCSRRHCSFHTYQMPVSLNFYRILPWGYLLCYHLCLGSLLNILRLSNLLEGLTGSHRPVLITMIYYERTLKQNQQREKVHEQSLEEAMESHVNLIPPKQRCIICIK